MTRESIQSQKIDLALSQAYACFLEFGIEGTTFSMIAQRSGLSLRSLNRYFSNKNDLVLKVAAFMLQKSSSAKNSVDFLAHTTCSGRTLLYKYLDSLRDAFLENPNAFAFRVEFALYIQRQGLSDKEASREIWDLCNSRPALVEIFQRGLQDGTLFAANPEEGAQSLSDMYYAFVAFLAISNTTRHCIGIKQCEARINIFIKHVLQIFIAP